MIDRWDGQIYRRVLVYDGMPVEIEVTHRGTSRKPVLQVTATAETMGPGLRLILARSLDRLLGLRVDLSGFYEFAKGDRKLYELSQRFLGMKPPRFLSLFETLVNALACQQLTLTVGILLLNRLAMRCGLPIKKGDSIGTT